MGVHIQNSGSGVAASGGDGSMAFMSSTNVFADDVDDAK